MSFSKTSTNIKLTGTATLEADCQKTAGGSTASTLDLDTGLGNTEGKFDRKSKKFTLSAKDIKLDGTVLKATLSTTAGSLLPASTNLDDYVQNDEGVLKFV